MSYLQPPVIAALIALTSAVCVFLVGKWFERRSTNRAVLAEIQILLSVMARHEAWWADRMEANDTNYPLIPFSFEVYTAHIKTIGTLRSNIVVRAVKFYGYVRFLNMLQASRAAYVSEGKSNGFDKVYHDALKSCLAQFGKIFDAELAELA